MFQIPPHPHLKINMMPRKSNFATHVRFPDKVIVVSQEHTKKLFYSEAPLLSCLTPPPSTQPMSTATDSEKKLQQKIFFFKKIPRASGGVRDKWDFFFCLVFFTGKQREASDFFSLLQFVITFATYYFILFIFAPGFFSRVGMRESPSRGGKNIASPPLLRPCLFAFFSFVLGKCADLPPPQLSFSSWLFFILGEKYVPTPPFPVRCKRAVKAGRKNKCFFPFFFSPSKEHQNLRGILTFDLAAKKENQSRTECLHPSLPHTYKTGKKFPKPGRRQRNTQIRGE